MSWCTIESDPGVFSELIAMLGVKDVAVEEIYSFDQEELLRTASYGLIFLFKWRKEPDDREALDPSFIPEMFFAKQVVTNTCATQALLSVLLNSESLQLGNDLEDFKGFTLMLDSESKGIAIGNSDKLRDVHNAFARPEPFVSDEVKVNAKNASDVYHFIAYIPFRGSVYELDGLKNGPYFLGEYDGEDWMSVARPAIEDRMGRYSSQETHFALLSIKQKKSSVLENEVALLQSQLNALNLAEDNAAAQDLQSKISTLRQMLEDEYANQERQRQENIRRRHNYIPLIIQLLRHLSSKGLLSGMIQNAKQRSATAQQLKLAKK